MRPSETCYLVIRIRSGQFSYLLEEVTPILLRNYDFNVQYISRSRNQFVQERVEQLSIKRFKVFKALHIIDLFERIELIAKDISRAGSGQFSVQYAQYRAIEIVWNISPLPL